jgi:hypothetical protein
MPRGKNPREHMDAQLKKAIRATGKIPQGSKLTAAQRAVDEKPRKIVNARVKEDERVKKARKGKK